MHLGKSWRLSFSIHTALLHMSVVFRPQVHSTKWRSQSNLAVSILDFFNKGKNCFCLTKFLDLTSLELSPTPCFIASSVTHGWFSSIPSFITCGSILWSSLVFNQICMTSVTFSYPMKLRVMYACCSSVSGSPSKFCLDEIWLVYMVHAYFNVNKPM